MRTRATRLRWTLGVLLATVPALAVPGTSAPVVLRAELGPGATEGLSPRRSGQSPIALPEKLDVVFRAHVSFGILELWVAHGGHLVVTTPNRELVELDELGRRAWAVALDGLPLRSCVLAEGTRLVATDRGRLAGFDPRGALRFDVDAGWARPGEATQLLPTPDGSFVAASLRRITWFESDGRLRAAASLDEIVEGLALVGDSVLVALRSGNQVRWNGRDEPRSIGDFGAPLHSLPLVLAGQLVALTDGAVVSKDPITGQNRSVTAGLDIGAGALPFAADSRTVAWLGADNALVRVEFGQPASRLPLGPETTSRAVDLRPVSDARGSVALLNALGELTLIDPGGRIVTDGETRCAAPVALLPQRPGRVILACRTGSIWAFGR